MGLAEELTDELGDALTQGMGWLTSRLQAGAPSRQASPVPPAAAQPSEPPRARLVRPTSPVSQKPFPEDPSERAVLVVLRPADIERLGYEDDAQDLLLSEDVHIVSYPVRTQGGIVQDLVDKGQLRPGAMLVQSPYDADDYEDAATAPEQFALAKYMAFSLMCRHLGAREVEVKQVDVTTDSLTNTGDISGSRGPVEASVKVEHERLDKLKQQLMLRHSYPGGPPDVEAAEALLRKRRLWGDATMKDLVELRRGEGNLLQKQTLTVNLSRESTATLSVVAGVKVPAFVSLNAEYERVAKQKVEYVLTLEVTF